MCRWSTTLLDWYFRLRATQEVVHLIVETVPRYGLAPSVIRTCPEASCRTESTPLALS